MASHPINLLLRFILEIISFVTVGAWAWNCVEGLPKYIFAMGLPILLMTIWGIFAVPNDPSRSGRTVIATSGFVRLVIELLVFLMAILSLYDLDLKSMSITFLIVVIIHYLVSYDRVIWLMNQ